MFQIFILHTNLDIRIGFFGYYFGFFNFCIFLIIRSDSANNILGLDMFCSNNAITTVCTGHSNTR